MIFQSSLSSEGVIRKVSIVSALAALVFGGLLKLLNPTSANMVMTLALVVLATPLAWRTGVDALHLRFATDVVALLCIVASMVLAQPVVGLVIVVMQNGGEMLDLYARGRASSALNALESAAPRTANRIVDHDAVNIPVADIVVGDRLRVKPGDIIPVDGVVVAGTSQLDTSSLTGESMPVAVVAGLEVSSGARNGTGSFEMRASRIAAESRYASLVELVRKAQAEKAPLQRLADKYAVWFTPFTIAVCVATLALTGNWSRVLAVLAVATPCPLILAAPVAIIGGINRAARMSMLIKTGAAIEKLGSASMVIFDKTGTVTRGKPELSDIRTVGSFKRDIVLQYAAATELHSSHPFAPIIVAAARSEQPDARAESDQHVETPGAGIEGVVDGNVVRVGSARYVAVATGGSASCDAADIESGNGAADQMQSFISINGELAGIFVIRDPVRTEMADVLENLNVLGMRVAMLSGDAESHVKVVAQQVNIADATGEYSPQQKAEAIEQRRQSGAVVMMVGDGVNDAPALAAADIGVAVGRVGQSISSEAADVVLLGDTLQYLPDLLRIGVRTRRIALESIWWGLTLSATGMVLASLGVLSPVAGAVTQELIDVAVILNALRSSTGPARVRQ